MEQSPLLPKKELVPHKPDGEKVRIVEFASAQEEARWIAAEIGRLHRAGQPWRTFAALYRIHSHRDALVDALGDQRIPFVIRNLSILGHPLVRDVFAYLRLLAKPSDNVACARVLAAPAWGLDPADLVRLCERTSRRQPSLWDVLQSPQGELPFRGAGQRTDILVAGINELRQRSWRVTMVQLFDALAEWLELSLVVSPPSGATSTGWRSSCANGKRKARRRGWPNLWSISITSCRLAGRSIWSRTPGMPCN